MNREQRVPGVVAAAQHVAQLEPLELAGDLGGFDVELARQRVVALRVRQLREAAGVVELLAQRVVGLEPALHALHFVHHLARPLRVRPHAAFGHDVLQLTQPLGLPRYVKGSSRAR